MDGEIPVTSGRPSGVGDFGSMWNNMWNRMQRMQRDMDRISADMFNRDFMRESQLYGGNRALENQRQQQPQSITAAPQSQEVQEYNPRRRNWGWAQGFGLDNFMPIRPYFDDLMGRTSGWLHPFGGEPLEDNLMVPPMLSTSTISNRLGRMFDDFARSGNVGGACIPRVDVKHTNDKTTVHADLPGMTNDDVQVSVNGNQMNISGSKKQEKSDRGDNYFMQERCESRFNRSFALPPNVTERDIRANMHNGVLEVEIDRSREGISGGSNIPISQTPNSPQHQSPGQSAWRN